MSRQISAVDHSSTVPVPTKESVCCLVDASGSMGELFGAASRLVAAQNAVKRLAQSSSPRATQLSLITFSDSPRTIVKPTSSLVEFSLLPQLHTEGSTDMARGMYAAIEFSPNRIIMLSDGQPTCSTFQVIAAAEVCKERGIKVDCTAIGDANDSLLKQICEITGGVFNRCDTPLALEQHYNKLESRSYAMLEHKS